MKNFILLVICLVFASMPAFAGQANLDDENEFKPQVLKLQIEKVDDNNFQKLEEEKVQEDIKPEIEHKTLKAKVWHFAKGKAMDDSLVLGMWSYHVSPKRDLYNETNNMFGIEYKGYAVNTFKNSYHNQTYFAGVSRKLWSKQLSKNIRMNVNYKAGLMHGYKDKYPNVAGITPLILPQIGFFYKKVGFDLMIIPDITRPIFCGSFRVGIPKF